MVVPPSIHSNPHIISALGSFLPDSFDDISVSPADFLSGLGSDRTDVLRSVKGRVNTPDEPLPSKRRQIRRSYNGGNRRSRCYRHHPRRRRRPNESRTKATAHICRVRVPTRFLINLDSPWIQRTCRVDSNIAHVQPLTGRNLHGNHPHIRHSIPPASAQHIYTQRLLHYAPRNDAQTPRFDRPRQSKHPRGLFVQCGHHTRKARCAIPANARRQEQGGARYHHDPARAR